MDIITQRNILHYLLITIFVIYILYAGYIIFFYAPNHRSNFFENAKEIKCYATQYEQVKNN